MISQSKDREKRKVKRKLEKVIEKEIFDFPESLSLEEKDWKLIYQVLKLIQARVYIRANLSELERLDFNKHRHKRKY